MYYVFGMQWEGAWLYDEPVDSEENRYRYNGKEYSKGSRLSDYGARYYSSDIGRWAQIDPLAEAMSSWSPYNYGFNAPVLFIDPDGMMPSKNDWIDNGNGTYTAEEGDSAWTLAEDAGITFERAKELMAAQDMGTYQDPIDNIEKSKVDPGDVVTVTENQIAIIESADKFMQKNELEMKAEKLNSEIQSLDKKIDSLQKEVTKSKLEEQRIIQSHSPMSGDPKSGLRSAIIIKTTPLSKERDKNRKEISTQQNKRDSLIKVNRP